MSNNNNLKVEVQWLSGKLNGQYATRVVPCNDLSTIAEVVECGQFFTYAIGSRHTDPEVGQFKVVEFFEIVTA